MDERPGYPAHWEADVVLSDGATAHVRPITPHDAERLVEFYGRVSDESKYYRFFAPYPRLTERDVERFTHVDHRDRVALIVLVGDQMIAVGRYDRTNRYEAEVAFLVEDAHQGRGLGSVLLEHLAQAGRERGIRRFVAETLPQNRRMVQVFRDAGYTIVNTYEEGVVHLEFDIDPTGTSLEVMVGREHRAEARSMQRVLHPRSVVVVGASRSRRSVGQTVVRNLVLSGFTGPVYAVNPNATSVAGVPSYASVDDLPTNVDLAVLAVPPEAAPEVVLACARKGVHGLVVLSRGYAESGPEGLGRQQALVRLARSNGMRLVGPNCLGVINTNPDVSLNASLAPLVPPSGRIGFFSQSGALGTALLEQVVRRGLGLSTFVSAGNRADVSGNDLMQYWLEDEGTDIVLLYLESLGNPRKFARVARALSRSKPVVAVRSSGGGRGVPVGHAVRPSHAPPEAVAAMFRESGVIGVDTLAEMFDVAQVLSAQPLPAGRRLAVVGNSDALGLLTANAATAAGLQITGDPVDLGPDASAEDYDKALACLVGDPAVDAVIALFVPTLTSTGEDIAEVIGRHGGRRDKPLIATFLARGAAVAAPQQVAPPEAGLVAGSVPAFETPEEAVRALARVITYAEWRAAPAGRVPTLDSIDMEAARTVVRPLLAAHPEGCRLGIDDMARLLACVGIEMLPTVPVADEEQAVAAGERLGWDVVLKATADHLRYQPDLPDVRRNIAGPDQMRRAWRSLVGGVGAPEEAGYVVQPTAAPGVPVELRAVDDPLFGPLVSFGVAGIATALLNDRSWRIPPITDTAAAAMVREVRASPLLLGFRGRPPADVAAVEDLLHRLSRLASDLPEVSLCELEPVLVAPKGLAVVGARIQVDPPPPRSDWFTRRLGS